MVELWGLHCLKISDFKESFKHREAAVVVLLQ